MNKQDQNRAACRDDPEAMYCDPGDAAAVHQAKKVCAGCPVRRACYVQAMKTGEKWGIWGGFTEVERQRLAAGKPAKQCSQCRILFVGLSHQHRCGNCNLHSSQGWSQLTAQRDKLATLAALGRSDREIAEALGFAEKTICGARQRWGIESGKAVRARVAREAREAKQARDLKPCGTPAAVRRHYRHNEPLDEACRKADARRAADQRAAA